MTARTIIRPAREADRERIGRIIAERRGAAGPKTDG